MILFLTIALANHFTIKNKCSIIRFKVQVLK